MTNLERGASPIKSEHCPLGAVTVPVPANDRAPIRLFDGDHYTTARIARLLGEFCSAAAMHSPDRNVEQRFLSAASEAFDAMAILERREQRIAGGARG
jgi:hypothetical protein